MSFLPFNSPSKINLPIWSIYARNMFTSIDTIHIHSTSKMHAEENVFCGIRVQCTASFLDASDTNLHCIRHAFTWKVNSVSGLALLAGVTSNSRLNAASPNRRRHFPESNGTSSLLSNEVSFFEFAVSPSRTARYSRLIAFTGTAKSPPGKSFTRGQRVTDIFRPSTGRFTRHRATERKRRDFLPLQTFAPCLYYYFDGGDFSRRHDAFKTRYEIDE